LRRQAEELQKEECVSNANITIVHVEDEPILTQLVQVAFRGCGFEGSILPAHTIRSGLAILDERASNGEPVDLILSDMQLPDGSGLELVRKVRAHPRWRLTPILVLSGETAPGMINAAYALGANCFIPKPGKEVLPALRSLYECWVQRTLLPTAGPIDMAQTALTSAIGLRSRTSALYLRFAELAADSDAEARFWLERSLNEGNLSNLLAFFRNTIDETDFPRETLEGVAAMQSRAEAALERIESRFAGTPRAGSQNLFEAALDLAEELDEDALAEIFGCLFPRGPAVTVALKERAAAGLLELAAHSLECSDHPKLRMRAKTLLDRARRIAVADSPTDQVRPELEKVDGAPNLSHASCQPLVP